MIENKELKMKKNNYRIKLIQNLKHEIIYHERKCVCCLCADQFKMQLSVMLYFKSTYPNSLYKCDFCDSMFQTPNGLFKDEKIA